MTLPRLSIPLPFLSACLLATVLAGSAAAAPATWPANPVRIVVGYAPGGATDVLARIVAKGLSDATGGTFMVENRSGANSNVGTETVARAEPDGYTLLLGTVSNAINASLYKNLNFDFHRDFRPISLITTVPNVLVVNPAIPVHSVSEYIAYGRAHPGELSFASAGTGSSIHLSGELFKMMAKIDMLHVPYRGSSPAMTDLLGGRVSSMFDNLPSSLPQIKAGKLRALAVTTPERAPALPDVPTVAQSGLPGFEAFAWFGLQAPRGTPDLIIDKLNAAMKQVLENPAVIKQIGDLGGAPQYMTRPQFQAFVDAEISKWAKVVTAANVTAE